MSDKLNRILTLIPYLREHPGVHLDEVARDLSCTPAELRRELNQLLLCGVPPYLPNDYVSVCIDAEGYIECDFAEQFERPIGFTLKELACLKLMLREFALEAAPETRATIEALIAKLEAVAPPIDAASEPTGDPREALAVANAGAFARERARALEAAAERCQRVRLTHYSVSRDALVTREFEPYALIARGARLYAFGHDALYDKIVAFRVDRIRDVEPLDATFAPPARELLDELADRPVRPTRRRGERLEIRFTARAARFLREGWDRRYFRDGPDGSLILSAPLTSDNWALNFALGYGEEAEILAPARLREKMLARVEHLLAGLDAE